MRAVIFSGGEVSEGFDFLRDDYIICADSGYDRATKLGIIPNVLIGDMDSVLKVPDSVKKITYKAEKDETDTELALLHAIDLGYKEIIMLGGLGGKRKDHSFANIMLLKKGYDAGVSLKLYSESEKIYVISGKNEIRKKGNTYLSIFPVFSDTVITVSGTKYTLCNEKLEMGSIRGISNEIIDDVAKIETDACVLVFETIKD